MIIQKEIDDFQEYFNKENIEKVEIEISELNK